MNDMRITEIAVKAANDSSGASEPAMFIMDAIRQALREERDAIVEECVKAIDRKGQALTNEYCHGDAGPSGYTWTNTEAEWQVILLGELADEFRALKTSATPFAWPALDEELRHILGKPCFALINIAELLRFDGYAIRQRAEDEQAVCLHWLLGLYFQRGAAWADEGDKQLKAINQRRIARLDEIKQQAT